MKSKILVLQHVAWRNPGRFLLNLANKLSIELQIVKCWKEPIPRGNDFDALILLGGVVSGFQKESGSLFEKETDFLTKWLLLDKPCLGFCLGHQAILDTFQAKTTPNFVDSIGFIDGHLTHDGRSHPLFKGFDPTFSLFKWHTHSIQTPLPPNCILLATSSDCVVEAFTIKGRPHIIELQFDNHAAHPDDVRSWVQSDKDWLNSLSLGKTYADELLKDAERSLKKNRQLLTKLIRNFMSQIKNTKRN